ncbi:MAG TPA: DNA polymerase III subunit gamma/tau [Cytophagales bacterium]|jgi:DNA polymerase-3 subunit gamma/tau|nr:DNA polymerase III subunit gamma/tau [Cytophagales bacterium]
MEKYVVSARKYRPTNFKDVVGQSHVTTTLRNAINNNKVAQSLLFCGPRGVGKTSCARILANQINGFNNDNPLKNTNKLNIYELDAASNNSVDDIRNLIDQVRYAPQTGKYKVYIIDEVHMLSNAAFNAFLKTLEEPPSYAIFILATTEKNKVIPTILSRCQIYDFNRIEIEDIKNKLIEILNIENIEFDDEALHIIAQKADGAMRDALSILDLIKTFSKDSKITLENVTKNLHILDSEYFFKISNHLFNGDISSALLLHNEILAKGFESYNLITGLVIHFRNLLVCQNEKIIELLEVSNSEKLKFKEQAQLISSDFIEECIDILNQCDINYKMTSNAKIHTEITLVKLSKLKKKTKKISVEIKNLKKDLISTKSKKTESKETAIKNKVAKKKDIKPKETPNFKDLLKTNNISSKTKKEEKVENNDKINKLNFNEESFNKIILEYANNNKNKKSEIAILKKKISFNKKNHSLFQLDNELESSIFENMKPKLTSFINSKFIEKIKIDKVVNLVEKPKIIYTNKDKYEYLRKKNKNLIDLKNKLGLDFEF